MKNSVVLKKIKSDLPAKIDCMLVCASYEERCLSVDEFFDDSRVSSLGLFYYKQYAHLSSEYVDRYKEHFDVSLLEMDISKPTTVADALIEYFSALTSNIARPNVVVDISTFTRESLLIVIRYLQVYKHELGDVYIFYRVAEVASILSGEVVQIRSVLGYMGQFDLELPLHLVILSGFEYERAKEIIDNLEPDFISIGYGDRDKSISSSLYIKNKEFTDKLRSYYSEELVNVFCHSLKNPYDVRDELNKIIDAKLGYNVVLAPLNNKLSTVGAGLAAMDNPRIQICYAEVGSYKETGYSVCQDDCYTFKLDL